MEYNYDETHQLLTEDWGTANIRYGSKGKDLKSLSEQTVSISPGNSGDGGKTLYIEGVFLQSNIVNGNKRIYPKSVLERAVKVYNDRFIPIKQSFGELKHPEYPYPDLDRVAIMTESLWWEGDNVMGRARVLTNDKGKYLRHLIEDGWIPCVSSRGLGYTKPDSKGNNIVQPGYVLTVAVDVVWGPSAPDAYLRPVYESNVNNDTTQIVDNKKSEIDLIINGFEKMINK